MSSTVSSKLARRERAIEAARRRLQRLEIETHRIKAELARLEANYEDDVADSLTRKLRRRASAPAIDDSGAPHFDAPCALIDDTAAPSTVPLARLPHLESEHRLPPRVGPPIDKVDTSVPVRAIAASLRAPRIAADPVPLTAASVKSGTLRAAKRPLVSRPVLVSFGVHAAALLFCTWFTFATLVNRGIPLFASPTVLDESPERLGEIEITAHKFADDQLQNVAFDDSAFNVADNLLREFDPTQIGAGIESLGDMGQLDAPVGDMGQLMAGAGEPGSGRNAGPPGSAVFFGAQSKGNRFVFVIDNSSSMKDGRFETALAELRKSVEALSPRQSFYVIFVSDQPYPMFFPVAERDLVPATAANKKRLANWVPNAILASGKNREWIKAMDLAASLQPHAVFLLWDGDMRTSDKVRMDVTAHLTRPNQWRFAIHTIGLGVTSLDSEYTLTAIAQAHGGTYRRIDVPGAPQRQR